MGKPPFCGEKLTFDFTERGIELKNLFSIIAEFTGRKSVFTAENREIKIKYEKKTPWDKVIFDVCKKQKLKFKITKQELVVF